MPWIPFSYVMKRWRMRGEKEDREPEDGVMERVEEDGEEENERKRRGYQ